MVLCFWNDQIWFDFVDLCVFYIQIPGSRSGQSFVFGLRFLGFLTDGSITFWCNRFNSRILPVLCECLRDDILNVLLYLDCMCRFILNKFDVSIFWSAWAWNPCCFWFVLIEYTGFNWIYLLSFVWFVFRHPMFFMVMHVLLCMVCVNVF